MHLMFRQGGIGSSICIWAQLRICITEQCLDSFIFRILGRSWRIAEQRLVVLLIVVLLLVIRSVVTHVVQDAVVLVSLRRR